MLANLRAHYQTIRPNLRRLPIEYARERIDTPDGDFLDLDWKHYAGSRRLAVLSHGLEGDSRRAYVVSMANHFYGHGWNVLAWNCRSCSGEMNRTPKLYSHGQTEDLATVVEHALGTGKYERVVLIGFSMGGNLTLKYLGTLAEKRPPEITHGVAFSSPVFIAPSADALDRRSNWLYRKKFQRALLAKMRAKEAQFPGRVDFRCLREVRRWRDFDRLFSMRFSGFDDLEAYYHYMSAGNFLAGTTAPVLIVNAKNDPIVPPECNPYDLAGTQVQCKLEEPAWGGHVGFSLPGRVYNDMDRRALAFVEGE